MGINTIAKLYQSAYEEMGVNCKVAKISGTSARKNLIQAAAESHVPGVVISNIAGHKVEDSKLSYFKQNLQTKKAAQIVINRRLTGQGAQNFPDVFNQIVNPELKSKDEAMEVEEENAEIQNADDE